MDTFVVPASRGISRRQLGLAAIAAPVLSWALAPKADATPSTTPTTTTIPAAGAASTVGTSHVVDGAEPLLEDTGWLFDLPSTRRPAAERRSELMWTVNGRPAAYGEGEVAGYAAVVTADLGRASRSDEDWHTLWQLDGPTNGMDRGPAQALRVRAGRLVLVGGHAHPDHDPNVGSDYAWMHDLGEFENDRSYDMRIQTLLTADAALGWVSVSLDGITVLDRWVPRSADGLQPGTLMPGQPIVNARAGLHRGSRVVGAAPAYRQWVRHANPLVF